MSEVAVGSTELKEMIAQEINLVAIERLSELYRFVCYFRLGSQVFSNGESARNNGYHPEQLYSTEGSKAEEARPDSKDDNLTSSEAALSSSSSWSDIPDEEFSRLLTDVYEQRRNQYVEIEKPKPVSNRPTMAEMIEQLQAINEEEPVELETPLRINRPVDLSFVLEEEDDTFHEVKTPEHLTNNGGTHAIPL